MRPWRPSPVCIPAYDVKNGRDLLTRVMMYGRINGLWSGVARALYRGHATKGGWTKVQGVMIDRFVVVNPAGEKKVVKFLDVQQDTSALFILCGPQSMRDYMEVERG